MTSTIAETFDSHWLRDEVGCWVWQRARQGKEAAKGGGYGSLRVNGRVVPAHRFSYELCHGALPSEIQLRHQCHNTLCVNPMHMLTGSNDENVQDRLDAGRYSNKLGPKRVREIRRQFALGFSKVLLALEFDVSETTIFDVVTFRTWKHV